MTRSFFIFLILIFSFSPAAAQLDDLSGVLRTDGITEGIQGIRNAAFVILRSEPSLESAAVAVLPFTAHLQVLERKPGWVKVKAAEGTGWMRTLYLGNTPVSLPDNVPPAASGTTPVAPEDLPMPPTPPNVGFVRVHTYLNVRQGPSTSYTIIGRLENADAVDILETRNGWHRIRWDQGDAWICGRYVDQNMPTDTGDPATPTTPTTPTTPATPTTPGTTPPPQVSGNNVTLTVPKRTQFASENIVNGTDYRKSWCGPASLAMVLDYHGIHKSQYECAKLARYTFSTRNGTPLSGIAAGGRDAGFPNTKTYSGMSMGWLREQLKAGNPVIVNVDQRWKGHYIVVTGMKDGKVLVNDPGKGAVSRVAYELPEATFWGYWASRNRGAVVLKK